MESTKNLIPCKFAIEEDQIFTGFYNPDDKYWNGWFNPIVTEDVLLQVLEYYTSTHTNCDDYDQSDFNPKDFIDGIYKCAWHELEEAYKQGALNESPYLYNLGHMWIWSEVE